MVDKYRPTNYKYAHIYGKGHIMTIFQSTYSFDGFFEDPRYRNYDKYHQDPRAREVFEFLRDHVDMLIASVVNHRKPAIQGVIVFLEDFLIAKFGWKPDQKENFFITFIGSLVNYLLEEFGFRVRRTGVKLRHNRIIGTAAIYDLPD